MPSAHLYGRLERLALAVGGLVMLAIVAASVLIAARTDSDLSDAARAQATGKLALDLLVSVTSAETGQRGFLLTGKDIYRVPYDEAVIEVPKQLLRLQSQPGIDDLPQLGAAVAAKMAELQKTLHLAETGQHDAAIAEVQTDRGQHAMQDVKAITDQIVAEQQTASLAKFARSQKGARLLVLIDAVGFAVLAALVLYVSRGTSRTVQSLRDVQAELEAANQELGAGRDRLEQAVALRTAELTDANDEIQRFAYIVSHDLRAPLVNIIGFTGELEAATMRLNRFVAEAILPAGIAVPEEVRAASEQDLPEAIRFIRASASKMDRLIGAILRLSREGSRRLTPEMLDMGAVIGGVVDSVRHLADAAGAELRLGEVPPIVSDRIAIEQVFSNLIENALKYLAPGRPGLIIVAGRREGRVAVFTVQDNGRGIATRDLDRVFELFRRAGNQDVPGEGIGLAHVRALLRRLGGTIACRSTFGEGTIFSIRLPVELAHNGDATE